jgi:hypothetical protein
MAESTTSELLRRIAALEAENEALRDSGGTTLRVPAGEPGHPPTSHGRGWGWTLLATVLITVGALLTPVAVVSAWARIELTDTDRFVAAFAPLAGDEAVQGYVTDEVVTVVNQQIDIPQLTSDVIDGITELGTGPVATEALEALKGPAAQGLQSLIESTVSAFVTSEAFANVWQEALRISHSQFVAAVTNDPAAAIELAGSGEIGVQLGPIIDEIKQVLIAQGVTIAERIPSVDRTVVVAQSDAVPAIQLGYGLAVAAGTWLPWIALLFLAAGVLVARRRAIALIWACVALALSAILLLVALAAGSIAFVGSVSPALLPADVAGVLYETVVTVMRDASVTVLVLALVVALVGWFAGPFTISRRLRASYTSGAAGLRRAGEARGLSSGRVGEWLHRQRMLLRALIAAGAAAAVIFVRPMTPSFIIWTLVLAALLVAGLELLQRPNGSQDDTADATMLTRREA